MSRNRAFSESMGLAEPRSVIQREDIDKPLRNKLWDLAHSFYLSDSSAPMRQVTRHKQYAHIWMEFFEFTYDTLPSYPSRLTTYIRDQFFKWEWYTIYDFLTFLLREVEPQGSSETLTEALNLRLEQYLSAYRWVGDAFVPVVDEGEIQTIEQAMAHPLDGVRTHLSKALGFLANRTNPDPANSIKESVSAVESLCGSIVGKKATLGQALKKLKDNGVDIHSAQEAGWGNIYGWTSDAGGVRHAMQSDPNLTVDDAVYFLVSCSAFVNLLTAKASAAGLTLQAV